MCFTRSKSPLKIFKLSPKSDQFPALSTKCSTKEAVLHNYAIFTGKHRSWSLFLIKLQAFNVIKKRQVFPVNIVKFSRTPILMNIYERLLL